MIIRELETSLAADDDMLSTCADEDFMDKGGSLVQRFQVIDRV